MPTRMRRLGATLMLSAALAGVLAGCAAAGPAATPTPAGATNDPAVPLADLAVLADPHAYSGQSTALLPDTAIAAIAPAQQLPVTVTSHDLAGDMPVTVASTDRILGLDISGSIAATIYGLGLGDRVVGRDISTTFAPAAGLPLVTSGGHTINSEAILALRPTVLVTDGTIGPIDVVLQLREAGIPVVFVKSTPSIEGVGELARQVGAALGAAAAGEQLATSLVAGIDAKVQEIAAIVPAGPPLRMLFLYLRGSSGIYYLFGEGSGADVLIDALGGTDVAKQIGLEGMRPMTDEAMVAANPDLILVMSDGLASAGGLDALLQSKPAIGLTTAGQHHRFVDMADGEVLSFGPRTAAVLDSLARAIYAPGK
ncbi:hemin ABC transporter substrate-binding protein [soil metagenome]